MYSFLYVKPFWHEIARLWWLQKEMVTFGHWYVSLWRNSVDVRHY